MLLYVGVTLGSVKCGKKQKPQMGFQRTFFFFRQERFLRQSPLYAKMASNSLHS